MLYSRVRTRRENHVYAKKIRAICADTSWKVTEGYREFLAKMAMLCQQDQRLTSRQETKVRQAFDYYGQWEQEKSMPMFMVEKKRQIKLLKKLDDIIRYADFNVKKMRIVESMIRQVQEDKMLSPKQKQLCNKFYKEYQNNA